MKYSDKLRERNVLVVKYREEARVAGIASPFRQQMFINRRLKGDTVEEAWLETTKKRKAKYSE